MRDVVLVVPLFEPTRCMIERLAQLGTAIDVVAVDDSPDLTDPAILRMFESVNVALLRHEHNRGIAAALNTGINFAISQLGAQTILTLDQDSEMPVDYPKVAFDMLANNPSVGLVYPEMLNAVPQIGYGQGNTWRALEPIQSGWLLRSEVIEEIGDFREELVIDCVDTDYYLRLLDSSWQAMPMFGANLVHSLGHTEVIAGRFRYAWHSPLRQHYIVRNRLLTVRAHWRKHPRWAIRTLLRTATGALKALLFGAQRRASLVASAHGVLDGVFARTGIIT